MLSTSSGTSQITIASVGRLADLALELLADRRPGDLAEGLAAVVVGERDRGQGGPVETTVGVEDPGPKRSTSAASAGCPGSTTARATSSASTTIAPFAREQAGHRRLAGSDPAGEPDQPPHCDGCYKAKFAL